MRRLLPVIALSVVAVGIAGCARDSVTAPVTERQTLLVPTQPLADEVITPADSAICRSGYSLPNGRSCEGIV